MRHKQLTSKKGKKKEERWGRLWKFALKDERGCQSIIGLMPLLPLKIILCRQTTSLATGISASLREQGAKRKVYGRERCAILEIIILFHTVLFYRTNAFPNSKITRC